MRQDGGESCEHRWRFGSETNKKSHPLKTPAEKVKVGAVGVSVLMTEITQTNTDDEKRAKLRVVKYSKKRCC